MKKLLAVIVAIVLSASACVFTACDKKGVPEADLSASSVASSEQTEESSSTLNFDEFMSGASSASASSSYKPADQSEDSGQSSFDQSASQEGSQSTSQYAPSSDVYSPTEDDFEYQTPKMDGYMPNFETGYEYTLVIYAINDLKTPNLTDPFYNGLEDIKNQYAKLSSDDKAKVSNYSRYEEARAQVDKLLKAQAEYLIENLTVPTDGEYDKDTVSALSAQISAIEKALSRISNPNAITNLSDFESKKASVNALSTASFVAAIEALGEYDCKSDYTDEYAAKIATAEQAYSDIPSDRKADVVSYYNELVSIKSKYSDTGVTLAFLDLYDELPASVSAVTLDDKTNIYAAKTSFDSLSGYSRGIISDLSDLSAAAISENIGALVEKMRELSPVYIFAFSIEGSNQTKKKTFADGVTIDLSSWGSTTSTSTSFNIEGTPLKLGRQNSGSIAITGLKAGGKISIYIRGYNKDAVVTLNGESITVPKGVEQICEFTLATGGDHTVTVTGGAQIFGVIIE